jgi:hypothetical protein
VGIRPASNGAYLVGAGPPRSTDPHRPQSAHPALDPVVRYGVHTGLVIVELRAVPGCPNLDATRAVLQACLAEAGLSVAVVERIGDLPNPSS